MQNNIVAPIAFSIAFISYKLGQVATQALVVSMINIKISAKISELNL